MKRNLDRWWPAEGQEEKEIIKILNEKIKENINYDEDLIIGFPGTTPDPLAVHAFNMYMQRHANNICTHTDGEGEKGFDGSHWLEKEALFALGQLMGSDKVNGYISSGGTESNEMGLILAREYFNDKGIYNYHGRREGLAVLTSIFTHYSIRKASWIIGDQKDHWQNCTECSRVFNEQTDHIYVNPNISGIHLVGTDGVGRVDVDQIESKIISLYEKGTRRFVIVSTEGNVMTGALDNTKEIGELISRLRTELPEAGFYLHVDAAIGGYVWPFLQDTEDYGFYVSEVDSITIDAHKMGMAPYPCGVFLYRKDDRDLKSLLGVKMGYVPGEKDGTLIGSRPGGSAAAVYTVTKKYSFMGYANLVRNCMDNVEYLYNELQNINDLEVIKGDINIVSWRFKDQKLRLSKEFVHDTYLVKHEYPRDFNQVNDHVQTLYKATVMPHVNKDIIDKFIKLLEEEIVKTKIVDEVTE